MKQKKRSASCRVTMDRAAELIRFQQFMTPSEWLNENMVNCITLEESKILEDKNCVTPGTISQFDLYRYPFAAHRRMWTVTNYFLVNLSLSDLLLAVLNCFFNFVYMLNNDWPFGEVYCRISNFVANVTVAASVFTLTATSFDRYVAIVRPLQPRMSRYTALIVIGVIWTSSCLLALPCLLYSVTLPYR